MKKKLLALGIAVCAFLNLNVHVAASGVVDSVTGGKYQSGTYTVNTTVNMPDVKVTVPATQAELCINPYELTYEVGGSSYNSQVVTVAQEIKNESNVGIRVDIRELKAVKARNSDIVIASAAPTSSTKTKNVFLYLEAGGGTSGVAFKSYSRTNPNQFAISSSARSKTNLVTLKAGNVTPQTVQYKINGSVVTSPAKAWTEGDKLTVSYKFVFTAVKDAV